MLHGVGFVCGCIAAAKFVPACNSQSSATHGLSDCITSLNRLPCCAWWARCEARSSWSVLGGAEASHWFGPVVTIAATIQNANEYRNKLHSACRSSRLPSLHWTLGDSVSGPVTQASRTGPPVGVPLAPRWGARGCRSPCVAIVFQCRSAATLASPQQWPTATQAGLFGPSAQNPTICLPQE